MKSLVVYESVFGNTEAVARAVADGLQDGGEVDLVEVSAAPDAVPDDIDVLVVGGPTHALSMTRVSTREDARKQAEGRPMVSHGRGIREWLEALERPRSTVVAATFDTKIKKPIPGSAAKSARKRLRKLGLQVETATTFYVDGTFGPLFDGEEERARRWGKELAATA
jgi:flavodoxin